MLAFFLPRLLATDGDDPAAWVHALGLQQLGEIVLLRHAQQAGPTPLPAELLHCQGALHRLGQHLAQYQHLLSATGWAYVQHQLQHTMPLVQRLLAQADADAVG